MSKSSARVCLRSLSESKGPPKSCPSLQAGVCLYSLSENKGPSKSCQSCPSLQGSVSAVSRTAKDLQSHVQIFRGLSPQYLGEQRTFKVMSVMSKSSRVCLRSLSDSKGPSKSWQSCPSLQGSVSAVSRRAKDHHTAQLRVCRGFRNVCSVLPLR